MPLAIACECFDSIIQINQPFPKKSFWNNLGNQSRMLGSFWYLYKDASERLNQTHQSDRSFTAFVLTTIMSTSVDCDKKWTTSVYWIQLLYLGLVLYLFLMQCDTRIQCYHLSAIKWAGQMQITNQKLTFDKFTVGISSWNMILIS